LEGGFWQSVPPVNSLPAVDTFMNDFLDLIFGYLRDHAIELLVAFGTAILGWYLGKRRASSEWKKKEFYNRLNVSLNSFRDGTLLIRTLLEKRCDEIFLNRIAAETVVAKARETTAEAPLLPLSKEDYWFYLNSVLNEIAERFAEGQVRRDIGGNVKSMVYLICLTSEAAGEVKTRKVRAMVVQKGMLLNLPEEIPALESPTHRTRWETLQQLAVEFSRHPHKFLEVEICV